ncbi:MULTISPECIES: MFS transporter [unclassified Streptomyces]|uniref:MFS transporter n=1 Tax=unclassified Streptomyces TaxID=2593676 RepID=UPI0036E85DBE
MQHRRRRPRPRGVVAIVVLSEFVPAAARGRLQTHKVMAASLGIPVAAWAGYLLVPQGTWGWRVVFALGLLGLVFAWLVWRWVPESPRWLASRGQTARAEEIIRDIERQCGVGPVEDLRDGAATDVPDPATPPPPVRFADLLVRPIRRRFLVVSAMWVCGLLSYAAFHIWTPTLLSENGLDLGDSLFLSAVLGTAAPLGALIAVPLIDRRERRTSVFVLCAVTAAALVAFGFMRSQAAILMFGCVVSLLFQMAVPFLQVYSAEVFPTRIRAVGSGTANGLSRISNTAAPTLVAAIFAGLGYTAVFVFVACLTLVGGLVALAFGPRTTGISLEDAAAGTHTSNTSVEEHSHS